MDNGYVRHRKTISNSLKPTEVKVFRLPSFRDVVIIDAEYAHPESTAFNVDVKVPDMKDWVSKQRLYGESTHLALVTPDNIAKSVEIINLTIEILKLEKKKRDIFHSMEKLTAKNYPDIAGFKRKVIDKNDNSRNTVDRLCPPS